VLKLLPVIDNIERAVSHTPKELQSNTWAVGVANLVKNLDKSLEGLGVKRIEATPGTHFNPDLHEAIMMEDGDGDHDVIAEELQAGYTLDEAVIRHSLVKVTKK
jgi:molecular chaperone GrpE